MLIDKQILTGGRFDLKKIADFFVFRMFLGLIPKTLYEDHSRFFMFIDQQLLTGGTSNQLELSSNSWFEPQRPLFVCSASYSPNFYFSNFFVLLYYSVSV